MQHLPSSPDLKPYDFFLFPKSKIHTIGKILGRE